MLTNQLAGPHLDAFLSLQRDAFWSVDDSFAVVYFNEPLRFLWKELCGRRVNRGDDALAFAPVGEEEEWKNGYEKAFRGESVQLSWTVMVDGQTRQMGVRLCPVVNFARTVGVAAHAYEVQEDGEIEPNATPVRAGVDEASVAKTAFLAHISHEIRTPLNAIVGMTELALGTDLTSRQAEYLRIVKSNSDALLQLIGDILDFSKIEAHQMVLDSVPCDLHQLLRDAVDSVAVQAQQKKLLLQFRVGESLRPVLTDPTRLRQVILNLLSNAIKYTHTGSVRVSLEDVTPEAERATIRIEVEDTGIGIHPRDHRTVFSRFYRAAVTHSGRTSGTGLGLSITRSLVTMMGGRIGLRSHLGRGSTFTVEIPLEHAPSADSRALAGARVLVASERDASLATLLEDAGASVQACSNGHEVLDALFRRGTFDSVVLHQDLQNPTPVSVASLIRENLRFAGQYLVLWAPESGDLQGAHLFDNAIGSIPELSALASEILPVPTLIDSQVPDSWLQRPARILLVEDSVDGAAAARGVLERDGHIVVVAYNGEEAVARYRAGSFDLVFMDVSMPEVDGLEATARIRAAEGVRRLPRTPIVAVTAHATDVAQRRCIRAGMDDFVTKPISGDRINLAVRQHVRLEPHILVVDDSRSRLAEIRDHLVSAGGRVTEARTERAAIELCNDQGFHVVMVSLEASSLDGFGLGRRLRGVSGYEDTPIIGLTALSDDDDSCVDVRFDAYISRPFERLTLVPLLQDLLMRDEQEPTAPSIDDLVPTFLLARNRDVVQLGEALAQRDYDTARRIGHQMKGCGTPYGFPIISELGMDLERAAVSQDVDLMTRIATDLRILLASAVAERGD
jgi:signal transduction histidine kinase/CheY-like chemotaxis protein